MIRVFIYLAILSTLFSCKDRLTNESKAQTAIDSLNTGIELKIEALVLADTIDFLQPNIKFNELVLNFTEIDSVEFNSYKSDVREPDNDLENVKPIESKGNLELGGYFILATKKDTIKFACGANYSPPCYTYEGFVKPLNSYSIGRFGEGIFESFLLDRDNNSVLYPGYEYDHGSYGLIVSPSHDRFMVTSSIDYETFQNYYDFRSYIVIYDLKNTKHLSDLENAYLFTSKDWEIYNVYWFDDSSFVLAVFDETKLNQQGSLIPLEIKYFMVNIE